MKIEINQNKKTTFTRMCISEAIIAMLKDISFDKLKVSDIVKKAGVSRMTFYKYYDSPHSALTDYLQIIISEYIEEGEALESSPGYREYDHILYSLNFFDKYSNYFLTLSNNNLHSILLHGINQFMLEHIFFDHSSSKYELYAYSGGLLNTFLKWEENGKVDPAEEVAKTIYTLYGKK